MNHPTKNNYQNDLIIQGLFYFPMMFCYLLGLLENGFLVFGLLLQFFVGLAQLLSGAVHSVRYNDAFHKQYFFGAIAYIVFLIFGGNLIQGAGGGIFFILFLFIVPAGIATWYYHKTWQAFKVAPEKGIKITKTPLGHDENLLDDIMIH